MRESDRALCKGSYLAVYFLTQGIRFSAKRIGIWCDKIKTDEGEIIEDGNISQATHIVAEDAKSIPDALAGTEIVSVRWLEACLAVHKCLPTEDYQIHPDKGLKRKQSKGLHPEGPLKHYQSWLGHWQPDYDNIASTTELILQAKYDLKESKNEPLVARLIELCKLECAIMREHDSELVADTDSGINHKALQYARAASVVRACAYKVGATVAEHELPFVASNARIIGELAHSGTCVELEAFRSGSIVHDSKGRPRPETLGANIRLFFVRLPGVGVGTAKAWWDQGFQSYEDVEESAKDNLLETKDGKRLITKYQLFSLKHREDLLEHCPSVDVQEMKQIISETLEAISGSAWEVWLVGGERRGKASHDADFVVSHATISTAGFMRQLVEILVAQGRMVSQDEGMCLVQGRGEKDPASPRQEADLGKDSHNLLADRHDRVVGIYRTQAGKYRRMDIIMCVYRELPFCLVSWTGSKQYNRFLRTHATNRGMHLNAHRLAIEDGDSWLEVPRDSPPRGRDKKEFWPRGWDSEREIRTERDIFELLEVPWREAWQRNCP